ncbi:hypothetical protein DSECCO2_401680 [anaerobic digester metagenome]
MRVLLPAPFSPRRALIRPAWMSRLMPLLARTEPKTLVMPRRPTAGVDGVTTYPCRFPARGCTNCDSASQGKRIQVSWLTSVMKVSTRGRPAGLA